MNKDGFIRPPRHQVVKNLATGFASLFSSYRLGLQEMYRDENEIDKIMRDAVHEALYSVLVKPKEKK